MSARVSLAYERGPITRWKGLGRDVNLQYSKLRGHAL